MSGDDHLIQPDNDLPEDDPAVKAFAACIVLLKSSRRYIKADQQWMAYYDAVLAEATEAFYGLPHAHGECESKPSDT